ncbi:hypothetical protein HY224_00190 [Candidatus Uhrbacteria bacterium]|nr:hypothetical protein [Candidatus Uhrbacteria bacterium]
MKNKIFKYAAVLSLLGVGLSFNLVNAAAKYPTVTSKLEADCDATRKSSTTSKFSLLVAGKKISTVTANVCFVKKGKVLGITAKEAYITFPPTGFKGWLPYNQYRNLFKLTFKDKQVTRVDGIKSTTDIYFNDANTKAVYQIQTLAGEDKLVVRDLATDQEQLFDLPVVGAASATAKFGDFTFSPKLDQVAVAVGYGPAKEHGEVYTLNIAKNKYTLLKKTKKAAHIISWSTKSGLRVK